MGGIWRATPPTAESSEMKYINKYLYKLALTRRSTWSQWRATTPPRTRARLRTTPASPTWSPFHSTSSVSSTLLLFHYYPFSPLGLWLRPTPNFQTVPDGSIIKLLSSLTGYQILDAPWNPWTKCSSHRNELENELETRGRRLQLHSSLNRFSVSLPLCLSFSRSRWENQFSARAGISAEA